MAKKLNAFRLEEGVVSVLKILAEKENRSLANMIEILIKEEAKRKKIKTPE